MTTQVLENIDALIKRKLELNARKEVTDVAEYAEAWNQLAADFEAAGLLSNAESCRARWMFYRDLNPGAYIRLIEPPFAEILPASDAKRQVYVWMD